MIKVLQDNLHNTVKDLYSLEKVTADRRALYLDLIAKRNDNVSINALQSEQA